MGLTLITEPAYLNPSKNPIEFGVETDNYLIAAGLATDFSIDFDSVPGVEDKFFSFQFPDGLLLTFTTKTTPDDSGTQIPKESLLVFDYPADVRTYLLKNYFIRKYFDIESGPTYLNFIAKEKTDYTNIIYDTNYNDFSFNGIDVNGIADEYAENFQVRVDVLVEDVRGSGNYINVGTLSGFPNDDDQIYFDLQSALAPYVKPDFYPDNANMQICENNAKRFKLEYYEYFGANPAPQAVYASDVYHLIYGGLRHIGYNRNTYSNYYANYVANKLLLTWKKTRRINKTQKEFIYWFNNYARPDIGGDPAEIYLMGKLYFTDGTNSTQPLLIDTTSQVDDVVAFVAGYTELGIAAVNPAKYVRKYELWLQSQDDNQILSETITFYVENSDYLDQIYHYNNSIGGFETIRTIGINEYNSEVTSEEASRNIAPGSQKSTLNKQFHTVNISERAETVARTGGIATKTEMILLKEFTIAKDIYAVEKSSGLIYSVNVPGESRNICIDDNHLYGLEFLVKDAFINNGFSTY